MVHKTGLAVYSQVVHKTGLAGYSPVVYRTGSACSLVADTKALVVFVVEDMMILVWWASYQVVDMMVLAWWDLALLVASMKALALWALDLEESKPVSVAAAVVVVAL